MYYRHITPIVLLLAVTFLFGCGRKRPKEMPPTYPCKITLTKDGNPVADASLNLISEQYASLTSGGTTNANGVAVIRTHLVSYTANGAPAGEFRVIVAEAFDPPIELKASIEQIRQMSDAEREARAKKVAAARETATKIMPPSFSSPTGTPLKITVAESKQGTEVSFEINDYK